MRGLALNTAIVGGAFVLSRVLGLVREAVIAVRFGTSPQYDAYLVAFGVPDTLFLLIIGGAVGSAFIPVFTGLMGKGRDREAWQLASTLINASVVLFCFLYEKFLSAFSQSSKQNFFSLPGAGESAGLAYIWELSR